MRKLFLGFVLFFFSFVFFSRKLGEIPQGITLDEAAFGYNAVLLSQTYHDENDRFMPVFVLSINGRDWRQPVPQYLMTVFFKIFGPSVENLRLTSVLTASISSVLAFILGYLLLGIMGGIFAYLFFITVPIVMIQAHLGLDNLTPLPFILVWLIGILLFQKSKNLKYIFVAALALGITFYSYKGARVFVPTWTVLTIAFLLYKRSLKSSVVFVLSILPFYLVIPFLEYKYAGAVLAGANTKIDSVYKFFNSYLASFDPSFLFVTGDEILHHSTGKHGMFLLASLPFFLFGLYQAIKKGKYWILVVTSLFFGPILFGFPGSYHRASRLTALIPLYVLLCSLGAVHLIKFKKLKLIFVMFMFLFLVNFFDFINYYWNSYAKDTYHIFYNMNVVDAYKILKKESQSRNLIPYQTPGFVTNDAEKVIDNFLRSVYFIKSLPVWTKDEKDFPQNGILMTRASDLKLQKLKIGSPSVFFYIFPTE